MCSNIRKALRTSATHDIGKGLRSVRLLISACTAFAKTMKILGTLICSHQQRMGQITDLSLHAASQQITAMSIQHTRKDSKRTPPGSFTKTPLTPPPSDRKSGTSVERIIQDLKSWRSSRSFSTNPWLRYKLSQAEYIDVVERIQRGNFVTHEVKYCCSIPMDRAHHNLLMNSDLITFRRQGFLCFGCRLGCMKYSWRALPAI